MKPNFSDLECDKESFRISAFIASLLSKTKKNLVVGLSGGIDSALSLYLAARSFSPKKIFVAHLYYFKPNLIPITQVCNNLKIPLQNRFVLSIVKPVNELKTFLKLDSESNLEPQTKIRVGNIMARIRMITLFDLAKKHNALVCGTENKSEKLLGYFTRFGDAASDIEPITNLYKTQVYNLAKYLKVPETIIKAKPSAGLWDNQTDEAEFGFSYQEADQVLFQYFDQKIPLEKIDKKLFPNAKKIISLADKNAFKHKVPYGL